MTKQAKSITRATTSLKRKFGRWRCDRLLHTGMGAKIAVTAWQHLLTMDAVDSQKMRAFIDKYEGIDHHNGGG